MLLILSIVAIIILFVCLFFAFRDGILSDMNLDEEYYDEEDDETKETVEDSQNTEKGTEEEN